MGCHSMMGCHESKPPSECVNGVANESGETFTENQIDTIRSTWPLLSRDMKLYGSRVFLLIFETEPKTKLAFKKFSDLQETELSNNALFQAHVTKVMKLIDMVVENMDVQQEEVEKTLLMLGAKHASFSDCKGEYFQVFTKCMLDVLESVIGEEFIPEVKDSWLALFSYITRYMSEGYSIYLQELTPKSDDLIATKKTKNISLVAAHKPKTSYL